jgi:hypothetical protein
MIKKELLEEFLNLYCNLDIFPFTNYEDALISNYDVLDIPFKEYSIKATGWLNAIKLEVSENLLILPREERLFYLNHIKDKLTLEASEFNGKNLITLLKSYGIEVDNLDYNKNTKLKELLNTSFKLISGEENLIKFKDLNREYYEYLLNIERHIILDYVNALIKKTTPKDEPSDEAYKEYAWFKVGLFFANGKAQELYSKYKSEKGHFKTITLELGFKKTDRPHFSETINNMTNHPKNIYRDFTKMKKIHDHCIYNKILVNEDFMIIYNALQAK